MKTLVIAEKFSQAEDLSKGLKKYGTFNLNKPNRFFESDSYIITWAEGHILGLKEPRDSENWGPEQKWELEALPWYPPNNNFEFKISKERIYNNLKLIFNRKDIAEIVVATDAGREGTLIAHELIDHFGYSGPVKRLYESASLTPENVQRLFETDLKGEEFIKPRVKAAYARAFSDLLLGMNFTIGFTAKAGPLLSIGRVKTPTMAILATRKKEILNFKEETYYELEVTFGQDYKGLWFKEQLSNTRFSKIEDVEALIQKIENKQGTITKKEVKKVSENPKLLYSLTTLQREASKKFGIDPKETLDIAQELYDKHKILSYPRTESEVIGTDHVKTLKSILDAIDVEEYSLYTQYVISAGIPTNKRLVNDKKLTDHHAIIPTTVKPKMGALNANERKIYDLVVKRFLSAFYPAAVYEKTEVVTEVEGETFKTSGRIEVDKGWKVVYGNDVDVEEESEEAKVSSIPPIEKGESRPVTTNEKIPKKTNPPKLYDYDMLLGAMQSPKKFLATEELKEALESAEAEAGLGTVATRADILDELIEREYIVKKGKNLDISDFGFKLVEVCPEELKSPEITAEWEGKLRKMELGQYDFDTFMDEIRNYIESILNNLARTELSVSFPQTGGGEEIAKCPHCSEAIRERKYNYSCDSHSKDKKCFAINKEIAKKKISESIVKELALKKMTKVIKGFTGSKGKFDAALKLDDEKNVVFTFNNQESDKEISKCPTCKTAIKERKFNYACESHSSEKQCFFVNKEIAKKKIPLSAVKELAEKGVTKEIKGFIGSKGSFDASLKLDENKRVVFNFPEKTKSKVEQTDIVCPFCGVGKIQENAKAFGCNNWKAGCKFTVWKSGNAVTKELVQELIKNGQTEKVDGFVAQNGSMFSAKLRIDYDKKTIERDFN